MKSKIKLILMLPLIGVLASCGYRVREVFPADGYNDSNFAKNFYREYDNEINPDINNSIIKTIDYELTSADDTVTTYTEAKVKGFKGTDLDYSPDFKPNEVYINKTYGPTYKMSRVDESFKYGYISKLFDGQIFCDGYYELARIQGDERGFGRLFDKEIYSLNNDAYFALQFKASTNVNGTRINVPEHMSTIDMHVSFYLKDGNNYTQIKTSYEIEVPTNKYESQSDSCYRFFAFSLKNIDLTRCKGFSLSYDLIYDEEVVKNPNLLHSLLYYEMMFVNANWR